ncbi:glycosyltransferase family 39 protein [Synechococcus sp. CB0205]|uniref:glycosyltransferase family 39 protein n=2 Tax=Synechococcaceae TaxID=1890426 RepID=UPI0002002D06|nr:glycosyltransferase family 39 protein [Synechococcus sp. CB0205]
MDLGTQPQRQLNRRDGLLLLALWLLCLLLDGLWIQQHQAPPAWDQGDHLSRALGVWQVLSQPAPWSGDWWHSLWAQAPSYRGPLTYVLSAPVLQLLGPSFSSAMASGAVFNGILLLSCYGQGRQLHSRRAGLWAALFVATAPALLNQRTDYLIDLSLTAVMTGSWWILSQRRWFVAGRRWLWTVLSGIGLGLVALTRPTGLVLLWLPLLLLLIGGLREARRGHWRPLLQGASSSVIAWLLVWPWFSQNWLTILSTINKARQWGVAYQDGLEANSLEGWLYYLKLLPAMLGSSLTALVLVGGVIALVERRPQLNPDKAWLIWWLSFPLGGLLICILMTSKDFRFVLPLLPQLAIGLSLIVASVERRWAPLWQGALVLVALLGALWSQFGWGPKLSSFPPHRPNPQGGWPIEAIVARVRSTSPNQLSTLAVLPDSEGLNAFNLEAEGRRQQFRLAARQTVAPKERLEEELSNFDWFLRKGGDQGVMSDERQARQSELLQNSPHFEQVGSWPLPDGSQAQLLRRKELSVRTAAITCPAQLSGSITAIPGGLDVRVSGPSTALQGSKLLLTLRQGEQRREADQALGQGLLRLPKGCLEVQQQLSLSGDASSDGAWSAELQLLKADGQRQAIQLPADRAVLLQPGQGDPGERTANRVALLRQLGGQLRRGELDSLFSKVGQLNQSDPEQVYLSDAEAILRARLAEDPKDLNDLYSLALAQALQRHAGDAAQTLTQIKALDPSNPNALLGLGVVELYRFRPAQAQVALDQAAKMSPNNSTLRTLRIVASALRLDLPQTLHLLRS